mgnify:CR=1 FL=1
MKTITIGRSSHCDIVIADERVSRVHAEITLVDNKYVYKDVSKNGSNIGGRIILNEKVVIAPGATVLLSNHIPLPWAQIYALLPIRGAHPYEQETKVGSNTLIVEHIPVSSSQEYRSYKKDELEISFFYSVSRLDYVFLLERGNSSPSISSCDLGLGRFWIGSFY